MGTVSNNTRGWLFAAPVLLLVTLYLVIPTLWTVYFSFFTGGFQPDRFIGFENFRRLFTRDRLFLDLSGFPWSGALLNNILWLVFLPAGAIAFGMTIAVLADAHPWERVIKVIVFVPIVVSNTATAIIFRFLYNMNPRIGFLNAVLTSLGFKPRPWLSSREYVTFALIAAAVWIWTAFAMTVFSATYKALDKDTLQAATVDGAGEWQKFWLISLPMMAHAVSFVFITIFIQTIKIVDLVLVATDGGPAGASRIIGFSFYWETFQNLDVGYGSAIAVVMLVILLPVMVLQVRRFKAEEQ